MYESIQVKIGKCGWRIPDRYRFTVKMVMVSSAAKYKDWAHAGKKKGPSFDEPSKISHSHINHINHISFCCRGRIRTSTGTLAVAHRGGKQLPPIRWSTPVGDPAESLA